MTFRRDTLRYRGARYCEQDPKEHHWSSYDVWERVNETPHLILLMTSDHFMEEKILRSELLALTSFMVSRMASKRRRKNLIYPVCLPFLYINPFLRERGYLSKCSARK